MRYLIENQLKTSILITFILHYVPTHCKVFHGNHRGLGTPTMHKNSLIFLLIAGICFICHGSENECTDRLPMCKKYKNLCSSAVFENMWGQQCRKTCSNCTTTTLVEKRGTNRRCSRKYTRRNCYRWSKRGYCSNGRYARTMRKCCKYQCKDAAKKKKKRESCQENNGGCEDRCSDEGKGVVCSCGRGHYLRKDKKTCAKKRSRSSKKNCSRKNGGCAQKCRMKGKKVSCTCKRGYTLKKDKKSCTKKKRQFSSSKSKKCGVDKLVLSIGRIVGGMEAFPHRWSWQGALYYDGQFMCGGALITKQFFLTAAHCVDRKDRNLFRVRLGDHQRDVEEDTEQTFGVRGIYLFIFYCQK